MLPRFVFFTDIFDQYATGVHTGLLLHVCGGCVSIIVIVSIHIHINRIFGYRRWNCLGIGIILQCSHFVKMKMKTYYSVSERERN